MGLLTGLLTLAACAPWRTPPPLPRTARLVDTRLVRDDSSHQQTVASLESCYTQLRAATRNGLAASVHRMRPGLIIAAAGITVGTATSLGSRVGRESPSRDAQRVMTGAFGVSAAAWAAAMLDSKFNPDAREARAKANRALATWIELRREMNLWETAALELRRREAAAAADSQAPPMPVEQAQDALAAQTARLRAMAMRCGSEDHTDERIPR